MKRTYHYCVSHQVAVGSIGYSDGFITVPRPIRTAEGYDAVKKAIAEYCKIDLSKMIVLSLGIL